MFRNNRKNEGLIVRSKAIAFLIRFQNVLLDQDEMLLSIILRDERQFLRKQRHEQRVLLFLVDIFVFLIFIFSFFHRITSKLRLQVCARNRGTGTKRFAGSQGHREQSFRLEYRVNDPRRWSNTAARYTENLESRQGRWRSILWTSFNKITQHQL